MSRMFPLCNVALVLGILACSSEQPVSQPSNEDDLAAIAESRTGLLDALSADDLPGLMARVTDDHFTMPPDGPTPPDNLALAEWHQSRIDQFEFRSTFRTDDIQIHGDIAIERWSSDSELEPREGGPVVEDSSKGVWIWERQEDGSWKLLWSVWNSNHPS